MNNKTKIVAGVGLAAGTVAGIYTISEMKKRRFKNMFNKKENTEVQVEEMVNDLVKREPKTNSSLSPIEKEKISSMVSGMSEEEMKITLQNIPMTLIFDHITGVLEKNRQFAQSVQDAMNRLQE